MVKLLDFYADWCGPCKTQDSILEVFEEETGVTIEKIDVDEDQERAQEYQVRSLPTLLFVDEDGTAQERFIGVTGEDELKEAYDELTAEN